MDGFMFDGLATETDDEFVGRECYVFNESLDLSDDDEACLHCRFYLTLQCKHIGDFVDEDGDA